MRITEQQLEAIQNKRNIAQKGTLQRDKSKSDARVLGRLKQGAMNKTVGHRIDCDMGDDSHIENHISPLCKSKDV